MDICLSTYIVGSKKKPVKIYNLDIVENCTAESLPRPDASKLVDTLLEHCSPPKNSPNPIPLPIMWARYTNQGILPIEVDNNDKIEIAEAFKRRGIVLVSFTTD